MKSPDRGWNLLSYVINTGFGLWGAVSLEGGAVLHYICKATIN